MERERRASGEIARSGVVLLTNRECPWRCLMCDLWKHTTTHTVPIGAIPRQLGVAVRAWSESGELPSQVKLYNAGSFFDPGAIPAADYPAIADGAAFATNVIVESHPLLVGDRVKRFRDLLNGSLEVALGLETAHPEILHRLNKGFDLAQFARAAEILAREQIGLRVFVLVDPPFMPAAEALEWTVKSARFAFDCGAGVVTLIPTRLGNGAMERLRDAGEFTRPSIDALENGLQSALALSRGRVFADTWGLDAFATCPKCCDARRERLCAVNLTQQDQPKIRCSSCAGE